MHGHHIVQFDLLLPVLVVRMKRNHPLKIGLSPCPGSSITSVNACLLLDLLPLRDPDQNGRQCDWKYEDASAHEVDGARDLALHRGQVDLRCEKNVFLTLNYNCL